MPVTVILTCILEVIKFYAQSCFPFRSQDDNKSSIIMTSL